MVLSTVQMNAYLNASEMAKLLRVDRATVSRWLKKDLIPTAVRIQGKQQWRIPISAYEELVRRQKHENNQLGQTGSSILIGQGRF